MNASGTWAGVRRILLWCVLVTGCALPLLVLMWPLSSGAERMTQGGGIVAWIAILAALDRRHRRDRLAAGAAMFLVLQGLLAIVLPRPWIAMLYAPTVWLAGAVLRDVIDANQILASLTLTLLCGAEVALASIGLGYAIHRISGRRARSASAAS